MSDESEAIPGLEAIALDESCDDMLDETIATISRLIRRRTPDRPILESMMRAVNQGDLHVPVISATLTRVVELMNRKDVCLEELALSVEIDAALATKLMGVANSARFCAASPVCTIPEALMRIGLSEAQKIVVALALRSTVLRAPGFREAAEELWEHSLLTGLACQALLEKSPQWSEVGFLLGLVHDIGHTVVLDFLSDGEGRKADFANLSDETIDLTRISLHTSLGALSILSWKFPEEFALAVLNHHQPEKSPVDKRELTWALYAGDLLAKHYRKEGAAGGEQGDADLHDVDEIMELLGIEEDHCKEVLVKMEGGFAAFSKMA